MLRLQQVAYAKCLIENKVDVSILCVEQIFGILYPERKKDERKVVRRRGR